MSLQRRRVNQRISTGLQRALEENDRLRAYLPAAFVVGVVVGCLLVVVTAWLIA